MSATEIASHDETAGRRPATPLAATGEPNRRVLLVDDNAHIHQDFRRVLEAKAAGDQELAALTEELFGAPVQAAAGGFELDSAFQGQEALAKVEASLAANRPYALAFVDVRMPPGWDGVKTTAELLRTDPYLSIVICSAYSDHSFEDMSNAFGETDRVLILKKPFDTIEVRQLAQALQRRWELARQAAWKLDELASLVDSKTRNLQAANEQLREEAVVRTRMETELRLAQKLETVGQLAAGIAHEINTPMQYIVDNLTFLREAYGDLQELLLAYRRTVAAIGSDAQLALAAEIRGAARDVQIEALNEDLARAFEETFDGVKRVTDIVLSMKEFSHPDDKEKAFIDLNKVIRNTLTVARNEYKYVANVETNLSELPLVNCRGGDIGQVLLALLVNAAHAIADIAQKGELGKILVTSRADGEDAVVITVSDTGCGIAPEIRERIFDPFFTTKEVGRGRGQGLAIARAVVDKHRGTLTFDTEVGKGTAFHIRLPIDDDTD